MKEILKPHIEIGRNPESEPDQRKYALLSVFDKRGIIDFARALDKLEYSIISSGGTARALREDGIPVTPVEQITGNPECFDGRMKTISFQVEGGILYDRKDPRHVEDAKRLGVPQIDIVACNLYPFEQIVSNLNVTMYEAVHNIDVGGPTMIRAAAKNHKDVLVVIDPDDYQRVAQALKDGKVTPELRMELAGKAFERTAEYDRNIAEFLKKQGNK